MGSEEGQRCEMASFANWQTNARTVAPVGNSRARIAKSIYDALNEFELEQRCATHVSLSAPPRCSKLEMTGWRCSTLRPAPLAKTVSWTSCRIRAFADASVGLPIVAAIAAGTAAVSLALFAAGEAEA